MPPARYTLVTVKPAIACVTVTYSPGKYLAQMLDSLDQATTRGTAVVLADNGSTDGAAREQAQRRENVWFVPTGGNVGYGAGVNRGVEALAALRDKGEIEGDYLLITNPDVVFDTGSVDAMIDCMRRNPQAGAVGPAIREPDGSPYPSARALPTLGNGIGHALLGGVWKNNPFSRTYRKDRDLSGEHTCGWLSGSCLLVRWEVFDAIGGFDERYFMYMEDVDLGDRLARAGWANVYCPTATVRHDRGHAAGKHPETMLPAHHASAYRFQADRHPGWVFAPLRLALRLGLAVRCRAAVVAARRRIGKN
ncbi:glycosyltransferase family 2 protein [Corynebacterium mendelii]|uniref:Glycosyltransferase family 2 protein n=1 Tax=Corynebacterium mendelii TaxID=2765362 RepID=A0A939IXW4_9CORY|nr:glycosyltransferase family 2 protein [Corynebacterium mendelii]MBN9644483.1 glycosyltransferase family 2 protein [Corynebacterium mendelii]